MRTKIIIIGAGPTGLMAACQLARFDCDFIIIDQKAGPTRESRAMIVTPRSLEIYQQLGLLQDLLKKSKPIPDLSLFIDGRQRAGFNLAEAGKKLSAYPEFQAFEQFKNEQLLYRDLQDSGRQVIWNTAFKSLQQQENKVIVQALQTNGGTVMPVVFEADYLLACDGASSPVRHALQIDFRGGTYQNKFFVADAKINWQQSPKRIIATPARHNFCAFFPMYGDNAYRILGTLPKNFRNQTIKNFNALRPVICKAARLPMQIEHVNWFSIYQLHHRCVQNFRKGNCFLLGDAAHVHSPAGGQGMNTGLQDAHNLGWKLALVTRQQAGNPLLATYHAERYPFARWLLKFTDRLFQFMTGSSWLHHSLRKYGLPFFFERLSAKPAIREKIFRTLSQLWYSHPPGPATFQQTSQKIKFKNGERCPYLPVEIAGEVLSTYQLLGEPCFVLFCIGKQTDLAEMILAEEWLPQVKIINLPLDTGWREVGVEKDLMLLIRPDQFITLIADEISPELLRSYFGSFH
jgi:2-polyprenyl-6-methoxyphenol hydroxylase-like FAD-dependent oxidoreductase